MSGNYLLYKYGIENQFSTYTASHVTTGSTTIATATVTIGGAFVAQSSVSGSIYSSYADLWERLNDGQVNLTPQLTTTEIGTLTEVSDGVQVIDKTLGRLDVCIDSAFVGAGTESNTTSITASTTQTQAGGTALVSEMNFVETVANENDAVTLTSVSNGVSVSIINDGGNTLQIFPALGDDLGNGINISTHLETHEEITFWGKDTTNWHIRYTSESFHGSMYEQDNSTEFVIHAANEAHAYHSAGMVEGDLGSWTYNAGSAGASITITVIADNSGSASGTILVTTNDAHGITVDDIVCHTGLSDSNYVGFFKVLTVPSTTTYTVTATWGATGTGFVDRPAYLAVKDIATGFYNLEWTSTMNVVGTGIELAYDLHDGTGSIIGSKSGFRFGTSVHRKNPGGLGEKIVSSGDRIFFTTTNETDATNITVKHLKVRLEHI